MTYWYTTINSQGIEDILGFSSSVPLREGSQHGDYIIGKLREVYNDCKSTKPCDFMCFSESYFRFLEDSIRFTCLSCFKSEYISMIARCIELSSEAGLLELAAVQLNRLHALGVELPSPSFRL